MATYPATYGNVHWGAPPPQKKSSTLKTIGYTIAAVAIGLGIIWGVNAAMGGSSLWGLGASMASNMTGATGTVAEPVGSAFESIGKWLGFGDNIATENLTDLPTTGKEAAALAESVTGMQAHADTLLSEAQQRLQAAANILIGGDIDQLLANKEYADIKTYYENLQKLATDNPGTLIKPVPVIPADPNFIRAALVEGSPVENLSMLQDAATPAAVNGNAVEAHDYLKGAKENVEAMQRAAGGFDKLDAAIAEKAKLLKSLPDDGALCLDPQAKADALNTIEAYKTQAGEHYNSEKAFLESSGKAVNALEAAATPDGLSGTQKALLGGAASAAGTAFLMSGGKKDCSKQVYGPHSASVMEQRARLQAMMNQQQV